jgi:hypothetical protein
MVNTPHWACVSKQGNNMEKIPAIYCDIDGVVCEKFATPNYDRFGAPNYNMIDILNVLGQKFTIVFITGRWAMGQTKVEDHINNLLPNIKKLIFCKQHDYAGTTAEFKLAKIKELESAGYQFYMGLDDHSAVNGLMHNHGMFCAQVLSD